MAGNTKAIKGKIQSISSLRKITRAMEMVARSKMKRAVDSAVAARPYTERALELLTELATEDLESTYELLRHGEGERVLIIHMASDKGLCGGYNAQALRSLERFVSGIDGEVHIVSVGKYATRHGEKTESLLLGAYNFGENVTFSDADSVAEFITTRYSEKTYKSVFISYTNFETVFSQKPVVKQILPITKEALVSMIETAGSAEDKSQVAQVDEERFVDYKFEPSRAEVLEVILPHLVSVQIYQALLESQASEQSARMVAMKSATDNATKLGEELTLRYNRVRQAGITNEIIEIAAGAGAV